MKKLDFNKLESFNTDDLVLFVNTTIGYYNDVLNGETDEDSMMESLKNTIKSKGYKDPDDVVLTIMSIPSYFVCTKKSDYPKNWDDSILNTFLKYRDLCNEVMRKFSDNMDVVNGARKKASEILDIPESEIPSKTY